MEDHEFENSLGFRGRLPLVQTLSNLVQATNNESNQDRQTWVALFLDACC